MASLTTNNWRKLPIVLTELCIDTTLRCGQSFRWRKTQHDEWSCALHGRIVSLRQDSTYLYYKSTWPSAKYLNLSSSTASTNGDSNVEGDDTKALLQRYLNLEPNLTLHYEHWSLIDPNFKKKAPTFSGVRILRQDAWEALIGFICSSNNNIKRISQMVGKLCVHYGQFIGHIGEEVFYDFPTPEALSADEVETHLRDLGFGYRAGYIAKTAKSLTYCKPQGWLQSLCNLNPYEQNSNYKQFLSGGREGYREAHSQLLQLQGVGPKVADCVCLMGLGWSEAVPIDTHVLKIAQRDYKFDNSKYKNLTRNNYEAIGNFFRTLWGKEAGWAHSVLFAADLKVFSERSSVPRGIKVTETNKSETMVIKRDLEMDESTNEVPEEISNFQEDKPRSRRVKRQKVL
ncbi:N-glycosylase/DNA lyase [Erysiphe neolycopersici]|uniref:DNA-(apurinic or apyrimidinic site) lyase n=1 Tax=Erysiphe neolycopersici TaxID=212602 RepID=A0A420I621_9PEZI|nr:N-glycosylase/DNA lyase [Erysiphe neolycopersici]